MKWFAQAPANIALIKYMGKADEAHNLPSNPSLSYTLNDLLSFVEIESNHGKEDFWEALAMPAGLPFSLTEAQQEKFLNHMRFLKEQFGYDKGFTVRSCNNFPADSGLASSASSFAALTKATLRAICDLKQIPALDDSEMAKLSREGSGSSCRSFFPEWVLWDGDAVQPIELPYHNLIHHVVIVEHEGKKVPSSKAHQRVQSSPEFAGRGERAKQRLAALTQALLEKNWERSFQIVWDEFQDMHNLFETAAEPFRYKTDASEKVLADIQRYWDAKGDGPLTTMDAGANVHLLFRGDQKAEAEIIKEKFLYHYDVI